MWFHMEGALLPAQKKREVCATEEEFTSGDDFLEKARFQLAACSRPVLTC